MFYLNFFLRTIIKNPLKGGTFLMLTVILLASFGVKDLMQSHFEKKMSTKNPAGDYFHALIPSKYNDKRIARKLRGLPGVEVVEVLDKSIVSKEVDRVLGDFPADVADSLKIEYFGLKVTYINEITKRSQELIRSYLKRLVGEKEVSVGQIFQMEKENDAKKRIKKWLTTAIIGSFSFCWFVSFFLFNTQLKEVSYIIERFQRRKMVALKSMVLGVGCITCLTLIPLVFISKTTVIWTLVGGLCFMSLPLIYSRRVSWE